MDIPDSYNSSTTVESVPMKYAVNMGIDTLQTQCLELVPAKATVHKTINFLQMQRLMKLLN